MRNVAAVSIVLFALLGAVTVSPAGAQPGRLSRAVPAADSTRDRAAAASKLALAQQILQAREEAQQRGPFGQSFRQYWLDRLVPLSAAELLEISAAGPTANLGEEIAASTQAVLADNGIQSLGDTSADMVYTKIAPCRVVDTRVTGGALGTASSRDFYVAGTTGFAGQGGAPCGIPVGATSVAVNVTVVSATGYGWLRAYPYGGSGNASVINFKAGDTIANGLILPICDPAVSTCAKDLTVVADWYGGHVLLDVMGYFQYVNKANYRSTVVTSRTNIQVDAPHMQCVNYLSVSVVAPGPGRDRRAGQIGRRVDAHDRLRQRAGLGDRHQSDRLRQPRVRARRVVGLPGGGLSEREVPRVGRGHAHGVRDRGGHLHVLSRRQGVPGPRDRPHVLRRPRGDVPPAIGERPLPHDGGASRLRHAGPPVGGRAALKSDARDGQPHSLAAASSAPPT